MQNDLTSLIKRLRTLELEPPKAPWRHVKNIMAGGLRAVGFGPDSNHLLVISANGRGVIDCNTGERVARDNSVYYEDSAKLLAAGIGPLEDAFIPISGISGGGLPIMTDDDWQIEEVTLDWPEQMILLVEPGSNLYGQLHGQPSNLQLIYKQTDIRAAGFSQTGTSLVIADSSSITIFQR